MMPRLPVVVLATCILITHEPALNQKAQWMNRGLSVQGSAPRNSERKEAAAVKPWSFASYNHRNTNGIEYDHEDFN